MWTDHTEYEEYQKLNQKNIVIEKNLNKYWDIFFNNAHPYPGTRSFSDGEGRTPSGGFQVTLEALKEEIVVRSTLAKHWNLITV